MNFNLKINTYGGWRSTNYVGDGLKICGNELRKHFSIPRAQKNIRLVVTKTKHPEAYELSKEFKTFEQWSFMENIFKTRRHVVYQLDGRTVQLYPQTNGAMTRALKAGYKYVRCTYE